MRTFLCLVKRTIQPRYGAVGVYSGVPPDLVLPADGRQDGELGVSGAWGVKEFT